MVVKTKHTTAAEASAEAVNALARCELGVDSLHAALNLGADLGGCIKLCKSAMSCYRNNVCDGKVVPVNRNWLAVSEIVSQLRKHSSREYRQRTYVLQAVYRP